MLFAFIICILFLVSAQYTSNFLYCVSSNGLISRWQPRLAQQPLRWIPKLRLLLKSFLPNFPIQNKVWNRFGCFLKKSNVRKFIQLHLIFFESDKCLAVFICARQNDWPANFLLILFRQWHQLTQKIFEFCSLALSDESGKKDLLLPLFDCFIRLIHDKINLVHLSNILIAISASIAEVPQKIVFLSEICVEKKLRDTNLSAFINLKAQIARYWVLLASQTDASNSLVSAKEAIEECSDFIEGGSKCSSNCPLNGATPEIHGAVKAAFYLASSEIDRVSLDYNAFYANALQFLSFESALDASFFALKSIFEQKKHEIAHDLCIAVLLGSKIYSFGEFLMHPVLKELEKTPNKPLIEILEAFNCGNVAQFNKNMPYVKSHSLLSASESFLKSKISLMALIEHAFSSVSSSRSLSFKDVSQVANVPLQDVEMLLMKSMSLKLIKGTINQIKGEVFIEQIQPRTLSRSQVGSLADAAMQWKKKGLAAFTMLGEEGSELISPA